AYARAVESPDQQARSAQRKEATLALLGASDAKLQASALRDLAQGSSVLDDTDVPTLLALIDDPGRPMSFRAMLLAEIDRKHLVDPTSRYIDWLKTAPLADLAPVTRAAGRKVN